MKRVQYIVAMHSGKWFVVIQTKHHGPYRSKARAIAGALNAARDIPDSEVLVQGDDGKFVEWTWTTKPPSD